MDEDTWSQLKSKPVLNRSNVKLFAYGSNEPLEVLGEFKARVLVNGVCNSFVRQVSKGKNGNLLGCETITKMGIVKFVNQVVRDDPYIEKLKKQYPYVFSGKIGKLKDCLIKLHIKHTVKPVRQRSRPVSFHLREGVVKTIQTMLDNDIIEKVDGPTPWVSPIVPIVKENGDVRVCLDARQINTAIEVFNCPTVDEKANELNEARFISKFDLMNGYNQLELHEDSRNMTVFATHIGTYRYKRLGFGIKSASEIFQKKKEEQLQGIPNCRNI
jgi:hypothetical protein